MTDEKKIDAAMGKLGTLPFNYFWSINRSDALGWVHPKGPYRVKVSVISVEDDEDYGKATTIFADSSSHLPSLLAECLKHLRDTGVLT